MAITNRLFAAVMAGCLMPAAPAFAHHGAPALYDVAHPITIKGTVTEFVWANPHCQIYMDVKNEKGEVVHWSIESNAPGQMTRAGWTRRTLKPGDEIAVTLIPAKSGEPVGFSGYALGGGKIVLANGQTLTTQEKAEFQSAVPTSAR
jgi:hypothetical protein